MATKTDEKADILREQLAGIEKVTEIKSLERLNYRLSDAIREGSTVTDKAEGWGQGESACALHAAVIASKARGYM